MRFLVVGDSHAAGEWNRNKDSNDRSPSMVVTHLGVSQFLHDEGHIVAQFASPGKSNFHTNMMMSVPDWRTLHHNKMQSHGQYGPKPLFWPNPEDLGINEDDPWHMGFDHVLYFWTGPLRSLENYVPPNALYHKHLDRRISTEEIEAYHDMCSWADLTELNRIAQHRSDTKFWLIGGQSDLPEIFQTRAAKDLTVKSMQHSFVDLVDPTYKRPKIMCATWTFQNQIGDEGHNNNGIRGMQAHRAIEKSQHLWSLQTIELREKIFNMWSHIAKFQKDNHGVNDAHPDRYAHAELFQIVKKTLGL